MASLGILTQAEIDRLLSMVEPEFTPDARDQLSLMYLESAMRRNPRKVVSMRCRSNAEAKWIKSNLEPRLQPYARFEISAV